MIKVLPLNKLSVGFNSPQGLQVLQVQASKFIEINMVPGQAVVVKKTSLDGKGTVTYQEFYPGASVFWEYEPAAVETQAPDAPVIDLHPID